MPGLQACLKPVTFELGRRLDHRLLPKRKSLPSPLQEAQDRRSASPAARRLGSSERGAWRRPASELAPCQLHPVGPRAGRGLASPYRPRLGSGFRPAHSAPGSAPAARTYRLVATASAALTPSCRVRRAAQLFCPLGPAEGPGRIHLHPQTLEPELWGRGAGGRPGSRLAPERGVSVAARGPREAEKPFPATRQL